MEAVWTKEALLKERQALDEIYKKLEQDNEVLIRPDISDAQYVELANKLKLKVADYHKREGLWNLQNTSRQQLDAALETVFQYSARLDEDPSKETNGLLTKPTANVAGPATLTVPSKGSRKESLAIPVMPKTLSSNADNTVTTPKTDVDGPTSPQGSIKEAIVISRTSTPVPINPSDTDMLPLMALANKAKTVTVSPMPMPSLIRASSDLKAQHRHPPQPSSPRSDPESDDDFYANKGCRFPTDSLNHMWERLVDNYYTARIRSAMDAIALKEDANMKAPLSNHAQDSRSKSEHDRQAYLAYQLMCRVWKTLGADTRRQLRLVIPLSDILNISDDPDDELDLQALIPAKLPFDLSLTKGLKRGVEPMEEHEADAESSAAKRTRSTTTAIAPKRGRGRPRKK